MIITYRKNGGVCCALWCWLWYSPWQRKNERRAPSYINPFIHTLHIYRRLILSCDELVQECTYSSTYVGVNCWISKRRTRPLKRKETAGTKPPCFPSCKDARKFWNKSKVGPPSTDAVKVPCLLHLSGNRLSAKVTLLPTPNRGFPPHDNRELCDFLSAPLATS